MCVCECLHACVSLNWIELSRGLQPVHVGSVMTKGDGLSAVLTATLRLNVRAVSFVLLVLYAFPTLQIFGQVATQVTGPQEARVMVARTLCDLQARHPAEMGPLLTQLPADQQSVLQQLVGVVPSPSS